MEAAELLPSISGARLRDADEHALIRRAQQGSAEAFEELFRRSWRPAYRAAYLVVQDSAAAEDIAQEAIIAAIRHLDRFDRTRPFGPWLHRITVNRAIDWARASRLRPSPSPEPDGEQAADGSPSELSDEVIAAISKLPEDHRAVVALRYVLDHTPGEIAEMLEVPRGTVNSRLRRALDALRPAIEEARSA